jgi:hypothetical protein
MGKRMGYGGLTVYGGWPAYGAPAGTGGGEGEWPFPDIAKPFGATQSPRRLSRGHSRLTMQPAFRVNITLLSGLT